MDFTPPPTKPPRGVKNSKETSGLLMAVIRTLSTSDSNEQRDYERTKLERDYKKSNQQLEELVSIHHDDLTRVMNLFGNLSTLISKSKLKVHVGKENLLACKKLLTCRREELKRLWLESTEYKYVLELLSEIEHIKEVPSQLDNHLTPKDYLQTTRLLMSAINTSETTLKDVTGLDGLRMELQSKKQELHTELVKEMKEQIYVNSTNEIITLKRQGSTRDSGDQSAATTLCKADKNNSSKQIRYKSKKLLSVSVAKNQLNGNDSIEFSDDTNYKINKLIECIMMLEKGTEVLEELKQSTQRELTNLTMRTTQELSSVDSPNILSEFMQIITEQFKIVLDCHAVVLGEFKNKRNINSIYDLPYVWSKMQLVLQHLVSLYIEIPDGKKAETNHSVNNVKTVPEQYDINSFFTRKKYQRTVKGSLFKFDHSSQSDRISKVMIEGGKDRQLLCKPSASYITQMYVPLSRFTEEIETQVFGKSEKTSKLSVFLNELIGRMFTGKKPEDIVSQINSAERNGIMLPSKESLLNGSPANPLLTAMTTSVVYTQVQ